jgi:hypothetical protein
MNAPLYVLAAILVVAIVLLIVLSLPKRKAKTTHREVAWDLPKGEQKALGVGKCNKSRTRRQSRQRNVNGAWRQK